MTETMDKQFIRNVGESVCRLLVLLQDDERVHTHKTWDEMANLAVYCEAMYHVCLGESVTFPNHQHLHPVREITSKG